MGCGHLGRRYTPHHPTGLRPAPYWRFSPPPGYPIVSPRQRSSCEEVRHTSGDHPPSQFTAPSGLQLTCAGNPPQLSIGGPPKPPQSSDSECPRGTERAIRSRPHHPPPHAGVPHRPRQSPPPSADPGGWTSQPDDLQPLAPTPSTRYDTNVCGMVEPRSLDVCRPAHSQSDLWSCRTPPQPEPVCGMRSTCR